MSDTHTNYIPGKFLRVNTRSETYRICHFSSTGEEFLLFIHVFKWQILIQSVIKQYTLRKKDIYVYFFKNYKVNVKLDLLEMYYVPIVLKSCA